MSKQSVNGQLANYNATPGTRSNGDASGLEVDSKGNLKTTSADKDANGNLPVTDAPMAQKITEGTGVTYVAIAPVGTAKASALWQAKKITVSGADTVITWAGGGAFSQVATDLTSLTYA